MELWKLRVTLGVTARNPALILAVARAPHPLGRLRQNIDQAVTESIQARYFRAHPDGLFHASEFEIFLHRKPQLLSATVIRTGEQEPATSRLIRSSLDRSSRFVDIGANIGWFTLLAARKAGHVSSFEPEPSNVELLRRSVQKNGFSNVQISAIAVSDHDGTVPLWISEESAGRHSTVWRTGGTKLEVSCRTLDSLFPAESLDLVKLDVEGAEPEVIAGARRLIDSSRLKALVMEWNPAVWNSHLNLLEPFDLYQLDARTRFSPGDPTVEGNVFLRLRS